MLQNFINGQKILANYVGDSEMICLKEFSRTHSPEEYTQCYVAIPITECLLHEKDIRLLEKYEWKLLFCGDETYWGYSLEIICF